MCLLQAVIPHTTNELSIRANIFVYIIWFFRFSVIVDWNNDDFAYKMFFIPFIVIMAVCFSSGIGIVVG